MRWSWHSSADRAASSEEGFSLVESIVAIALAGVIFTAMAGLLLSSLSQTMLARQAQQATDIGTRFVEEARDLDTAALGLNATQGASDPAIVAGKYAVKLADGTTANENVVYVANSPMSPHRSELVIDGTRFQIARYVTNPGADAVTGAAYKRLTVVVSWTVGAKTRNRTTSTFITKVRRGLPQPKFEWAFNGATQASQPAGVTVNRAAVLTVSAVLTNRGARDRWNVSTNALATNGATRPWSFAWFFDNGAGSLGCNGVRDAGEDETADPDNNGAADTDTINTDRFVCLVGTYTVPATESTSPATVDLKLTATSNAVNTVSKVLTTRVTVANQTCAGCTYQPYYLHSAPAGVPTTSQSDSPVNGAVPSETALQAMSTDVDAFAGRFLGRGAAPSDTDSRTVAVFTFAVPSTCSVKAASAFVQLYGMTNDADPGTAGGFNAELSYEGSSGSFTAWGAAATNRSAWGQSTFDSVSVPVTLASDQTLSTGQRIRLRLTVPSSAGTDMRLAYDTTTAPAALVLPVAAGC